MNIRPCCKVWLWGVCCVVMLLGGTVRAQQPEIPEALQPWKDWVTWKKLHPNCPTRYSSADQPVCYWPSRLALTADPQQGSWSLSVNVFEESWVPLPGNGEIWPLDVRANDKALPVVQRDGRPALRLPVGEHQLEGAFQWDTMPQRIAIPKQVGLLSLNVDGQAVPIPNWDADGHVWLRRVRAQATDQDLLAAQVYRVIEDGIPLWLRTEIELTVSGKSREEELGWILPDGWKLSMVESPIPVAVDEQGRMKCRCGPASGRSAWHAFRTTDAGEIRFAADAQPIAGVGIDWLPRPTGVSRGRDRGVAGNRCDADDLPRKVAELAGLLGHQAALSAGREDAWHGSRNVRRA